LAPFLLLLISNPLRGIPLALQHAPLPLHKGTMKGILTMAIQPHTYSYFLNVLNNLQIDFNNMLALNPLKLTPEAFQHKVTDATLKISNFESIRSKINAFWHKQANLSGV
jgi:hypothetical protein